MSLGQTITGVGIDIEDIVRFKQKPYPEHISFYTKIFTPQELTYCRKKKNPYPHLAVRFCAKEALIKAVDKKISDYRDIEVILVRNKPFVVWQGKRYTASLSHDKDKAIAIVLA